MDRLLIKANEEGSIDGLYAAIRENPCLLANIEQTPFVDTPLHAAASAGHIPYAMEIMRLIPSFAKKCNNDGFTPIHMALQKQHLKLVVSLLNIDSDLVRVKGREGITPLHCVVENGNFHLLNRFLAICPRSIEDVNIRSETALHIALRYNQFEIFEFILEMLRWDCHEEARYLEKKIVNWKNVEGDSVLHIATSKNQPQLVKLLSRCRIDVKAKNFAGQTALDIAKDGNMDEIWTLLCCIGAASPSSSFHANETTEFLRKDRRLQMAAGRGDVDALYSIICEDPYLLDRIDQAPFMDNPMHIAASSGHSRFVLEIMVLKPSLAKKLNQDGFSPMHLALQNDQFQIVRWLVEKDSDLVRIAGRSGQTPLHYVAEKGNVDLLIEFLLVCPKSVQDLTTCKETALHVAAKRNMWEVFRILCGWLQLTGQTEVLNWTDDEGNSVLHIAASKIQLEAVRLLVRKMNLSIKNINNETAMDILNEHPPQTNTIRAIKEILISAGALKVLDETTSFAETLEKKMTFTEKWALSRYREKLSMSDENRNAVLVVAVLIATATYQAVLSPPGGVWEGDPQLLLPQENETDFQRRFRHHALSRVGLPVFRERSPKMWYFFSCLNTATFIISVGAIYVLLPRRPLIILPLVIPLFLCYGISWFSTQAGSLWSQLIMIVVFLAVPVLMEVFSRMFGKKWKKLQRLIADYALKTQK